MSILFDAVTRSKQQEAHSDPLLTPRLDLYAKPPRSPLGKKVMLFVLMIALSVVLAWVMVQAVNEFMGTSAPSKLAIVVNDEVSLPNNTSLSMETSKLAIAENDEVSVSNNTSLPIENNQENNRLVTDVSQSTNVAMAPVTFVGKATLPVPQAQPLSQVQPATRVATLLQTDNVADRQLSKQVENLPVPVSETPLTIAAKSEVSAQEPIILGANSNQKGQDRLAALKKEVAKAASEVGLQEKSAQVPAQPKAKPSQVTGSYQAQANSVPSKAVNTTDNQDNALLIAQLQKELRQVERKHAQEADPQTSDQRSAEFDNVPKYGQLPAAVQRQVPEFNINGHVYSTNAEKRWLNVDGMELQQGDMIQGKLKIIEIRPQDVVLEVSGNKFSVPAA
ncbi:general secretion pathway protein GspB [uncultured Shewanella sp.]|uniref:general secretion pathway protein GspB n=1 Tax=uncultured Shewanella sp. TaxID=173975 RepID=UPI0026058654|nr:general secretion pathway protein GspB [uncultured Shewanella sp.]